MVQDELRLCRGLVEHGRVPVEQACVLDRFEIERRQKQEFRYSETGPLLNLRCDIANRGGAQAQSYRLWINAAVYDGRNRVAPFCCAKRCPLTSCAEQRDAVGTCRKHVIGMLAVQRQIQTAIVMERRQKCGRDSEVRDASVRSGPDGP